MRLFFVPEEPPGLAFSDCLAALRAEGVPVKTRRDWPEHLRPFSQKGFDLYGHGRGPIGPGTYDCKAGNFPVAEDLLKRTLLLPAYIDPPEGLLEQIIAGFRKVAELYESI